MLSMELIDGNQQNKPTVAAASDGSITLPAASPIARLRRHSQINFNDSQTLKSLTERDIQPHHRRH